MNMKMTIALTALMGLIGCGKQQADPNAAAPVEMTYEFHGATMTLPATWRSADEPQIDGALVFDAAVVGERRPQIYLHQMPEWEYSPERMRDGLDAMVENIASQRNGFVLDSSESRLSEQGWIYGQIDYERFDPEDRAAIRERVVLIPRLGGAVLIVHATVDSALWGEYEPIVAGIVDSIRLPR